MYALNGKLQKNLTSAFKQPSLGIEFGGDYLLAVIHSHYAYPQRRRDRFWRNIDVIEIVPILLQMETYQFDGLSDDVTHHLANLCTDVKTDQIRLQRLLIVLTQADLEWDSNKRRPRNLLRIVTVIKKHILEPSIKPTRYYKRLADSIAASRSQFIKEWNYQIDKNLEEFQRECAEVVDALSKGYSDTFDGANIITENEAGEMETELRFWTGREYTWDKLTKLIQQGGSDPIHPEHPTSSSGDW